MSGEKYVERISLTAVVVLDNIRGALRGFRLPRHAGLFAVHGSRQERAQGPRSVASLAREARIRRLNPPRYPYEIPSHAGQRRLRLASVADIAAIAWRFFVVPGFGRARERHQLNEVVNVSATISETFFPGEGITFR